MSTEDKIMSAAYKVFLLFGYYGTTLQQIAFQAGVNRSVIHYYFRPKERLYVIIVKTVLDNIIYNRGKIDVKGGGAEKPDWFLTAELYNNKDLFEKSLKELYPDGWKKKLNEINKRIELASVF